MKTITTALVSACALLAFFPACAVDSGTEEEIAQGQEQALCSNQDGVNSVMSAIAVATARELHRWMPTRDFQWDGDKGQLELSSYGNKRCLNQDCVNVKALLAMQDAPSRTVQFPGGIWLDSAALKSALKANWDEQVRCNADGTCHQDSDDLAYRSAEFGSCGVKYFFDVYKSYSTQRISDTASLTALNDNLTFLGFPENRMLNFYLRDGKVSVDPTVGLTEGGTTTSGSCTAACTMFSTRSVSGDCCSCNGTTKSFSRSPFSYNMYLCR